MLFYRDTIDPDALGKHELDMLLGMGWYRMNQYLFTISHIHLDELYQVHWLRFDVNQVKSHASHQRIRRKNKNFSFTIEPAFKINPEHQLLHQKYYASIDFEGASSIEECLYGESTGKNIFDTWCISVYDDQKLIAAGYFDLGKQAGASILHFYDPAYAYYSPGKYLILLTIDYLRQQGYTWYYPGYVVRGQPKMDYKLFLGREQAEYFDPEVVDWRPFEDHLLDNTPQHRQLIADFMARARKEA